MGDKLGHYCRNCPLLHWEQDGLGREGEFSVNDTPGCARWSNYVVRERRQ